MLFEDTEFGSFDEAESKAQSAYELYEQGKISSALLEIQQALDIDPANSAWHFNKALALDAIDRFDDAIIEYEAAQNLKPDDPEILNSLAVDYTRTGQYDRAIDTFEHIQQLDPNFEPCYCNRIITYTEMGLHDLAEETFYLAQQINPDCALCYYNIGDNLFIRGEYKKAFHCWLRTAELEPTHPQINYRIAQACWADGDYDRAREHFLNELRVNPGDIDVIFDSGLFQLEQGNIESAKENFHRILEFNPDFAPAFFYLGEIAFNNADYDQALELFNNALEKDASLSGPHYRMAQHALMTSQCQSAKSYLLAEVELAHHNPNTLVSIASMFMALGDFDSAIRCLLRAIATDNFNQQDFTDILRQAQPNADAYYYLGLIYSINDQFAEAAEFFAHALDIKPDDVDVLRDSALTCLAMGRNEDAAQRIKRALSLKKNDPHLKAIYFRIKISRKIQQLKSFLASMI